MDGPLLIKGVARGGSLPEFGRSVNPIQTRGQILPNTLLPAPEDSKSYLQLMIYVYLGPFDGRLVNLVDGFFCISLKDT